MEGVLGSVMEGVQGSVMEGVQGSVWEGVQGSVMEGVQGSVLEGVQGSGGHGFVLTLLRLMFSVGVLPVAVAIAVVSVDLGSRG